LILNLPIMTPWARSAWRFKQASRISVADVPVEHDVKLLDFTKYLDRTVESQREASDRYRIRSILGMPVARLRSAEVPERKSD
jgi:hypothetical protein